MSPSIYLGDAALEEGVFHESANFCRAARSCQSVFVCENNLYSVYTNSMTASRAAAHRTWPGPW